MSEPSYKCVPPDKQIIDAVKRRLEKGPTLPFHCANGHESVRLARLGLGSCAVLTCPRCHLEYYCSALPATAPGEPGRGIQVTIGCARDR